MIPAFCELSANGKRIEVHFRFNQEALDAVKLIPGARFTPRDKGGPFWTIPKDMECAIRLREIFGTQLTLGDAVRAWGNEARVRHRNLGALAKADEAELENLPVLLPDLHNFMRPYQHADVAFLAETSALNANQPGLGKTVEIIGAIYEGLLHNGPQLVIAPLTSLETVWQYEFEKWTDLPVVLLSGSHKPPKTVLGALSRAAIGNAPCVLVTTAAQVRRGLPNGLDKVKWRTVTVDEFHKTGATNISGDPTKGTQFGRALRDIERERMWFVSGTPMGGKPIKLWGALNHIHPEVFTSKWRWAELWLEVTKPGDPGSDGYGWHIGPMRKDKLDEFYPAHSRYIVRRLKSEVLPQLPAKQYIDVWCDMLPAQRRQYEKMEQDAEIRIEEERLSARGILAEYTRLKQFSNAECRIEGGKLKPVKSGKLEYLLERLDERGIRPTKSSDGLAPEGDEVAVVASQSEEYVSWLTDELNRLGIPAEKITGNVNAKQRADLTRRFQSGDASSPRVIVMTTTAGGVAITLDRADSVHLMDETWNPDDQEQVEDRVHRISRIHQVMCYYYRSKGTVEERIWRTAAHKKVTSELLLDVQRKHFKGA